ncbi:MAG: zf-HC2 domain-containing protein [PVC group bacterium]
MKKIGCRKIESWLDLYYDGRLSSESIRACEAHLENCESCRRRLHDRRILSGALAGLARQEAGQGEGVSFWPAVRARLAAEAPFGEKRLGRRSLQLIPRPAWIGVALSAAAALALFFSGVLTENRLPENYCRIESISAPEHNLMIFRGESDGLTIIWLME